VNPKDEAAEWLRIEYAAQRKLDRRSSIAITIVMAMGVLFAVAYAFVLSAILMRH
jgi:hypothetical protein